MKKGNFTLIKKYVLLFAFGFVLCLNGFAQATPADYSTATAVTLNANDLSGKYVIKTESNVYLSPIMASDNGDVTAIATTDLSASYAFDIAINADGMYTIKSADLYMVYGLTNNWFFELVSAGQGGKTIWKINLLANNSVTFQRSDEALFLKSEPNGNAGLIKFYTNSESSVGNSYTLLKVADTSTGTFSDKAASKQVVLNVSGDYLTIKNASEVASLTIYDTTGRQVAHKTNSNDSELAIPLTSYSKGIYIIKTTDSNGHINSSKFVVK